MVARVQEDSRHDPQSDNQLKSVKLGLGTKLQLGCTTVACVEYGPPSVTLGRFGNHPGQLGGVGANEEAIAILPRKKEAYKWHSWDSLGRERIYV